MAFLDSLKTLFIESIPDMVIKYSNEAKIDETVESKRAGDRYVAAMMKTDNFNNYSEFSLSSLLAAGLADHEAKICHENKKKIPYDKRDKVVEYQRAEIIESYTESNDYYRTLYGLPLEDDIEQIWVEKEIYDKYNVTPCAIHQLDHNVLLSMEALGELDAVKATYTDKKYRYLDYLGKRKIPIEKARLADNYQILYFPKIDNNESFYRDFISTYEECREYFLTVIYNQYYSNKYVKYDNYLAFNILIMTINKLIPNMLKKYVERDFYDLDTIRSFLEAYGVPFNSNLSITQLNLICKNLNILLKSKATTQVFVDILDLLGYANFTLMKYYLFKQHKMDANGKPLFYYKTVQDESGHNIEVLDKEKMYDIYFLHTDIDSYSVQEYLHDDSKKVSYGAITSDDRYWIEDEELLTKLYNTDFNYIETKYMDIDIVHRMHKILFETVYLSRLILDGSNTKNIMVSMNAISNAQVPIFDIIILLVCLLCKYYDIEPSVMNSPSKKLYILGFNFKADIESIKADIIANPDMDNSIISYINQTVFTSPSDINRMYVNVLELEKALTKRLSECETIELYNAYDKLYKTLLWQDIDNSYITLKNGKIPDTFDQYLKESNSAMYVYYNNCSSRDEISIAIDYITGRLTNLFTDAHYLNSIRVLDDNLIIPLLQLLNYFKTYTVTMKNANLIIKFDSRYYNMIHMATRVRLGNGETMYLTIPDSSIIDQIQDSIRSEIELQKIDQSVHMELKTMPLADITLDINNIFTHDLTAKSSELIKHPVKLPNKPRANIKQNLTGNINQEEDHTFTSTLNPDINIGFSDKFVSGDISNAVSYINHSVDVYSRPLIDQVNKCMSKTNIRDSKKFIWHE